MGVIFVMSGTPSVQNSSGYSDLSDDFQPKKKKKKLSGLSAAHPTKKRKQMTIKNSDADAWNVSGIDEPTLQYLQVVLFTSLPELPMLSMFMYIYFFSLDRLFFQLNSNTLSQLSNLTHWGTNL